MSSDKVKNTSEGTFFFEADDELPPWRLGAKGWEVASLAPPSRSTRPTRHADFEAGAKAWYETNVLVGPGGRDLHRERTGVSPGTRTTRGRVSGKPERIGRETSRWTPSSSFPHGRRYALECFSANSNGSRTADGRESLTLPRDRTFSRLESVSTNGPPWLLLDRSRSACRAGTRGPGGKPATQPG